MTETESPSPAQRFIAQMGWLSRPSGTENAAIHACPFCSRDGYKFNIAIGGEKDGLYRCVVCGASGNLHQLKAKVGVSMDNAVSVKDMVNSKITPSPLPNFLELHDRLINDPEYADVLDHLLLDRKYSEEVIKRWKIGAEDFAGKKWYVIPYWDATGHAVFYKARTVPPFKKEFRAPAGRETPLFNEPALKPGLDELWVTEGEADCLTMLSQGYSNVVGVPGASMRKASWLDKLDSCAPKIIYLLYDNDKPGQDAAREMGNRIGLDKVRNIILPPFQIGEKTGKDINEYFAAGFSKEDFEKLKAEAKPFDVHGVQSVGDILNELREELESKGVEPTFKSPWPTVTKLIGGAEPGDLIGVMADGKVGKSLMCLNWLEYFAEQGESVLNFCLEMPPKRSVRRWASMVTQTDDTPGQSQMTPDTIKAAMKFAAEGLKGDFLFGYTRSVKPEDIFDTIRQAVRRYGVKIVCFDNLQLLIRSVEHASQETSKLTKQFKALAMELNILILLIIQPNRVPEGQMVSARNAMGSSAIEKDVDTMLCLHRERVGAGLKPKDLPGFVQMEENFGPQMYIRADLTRYAPGGMTTLLMDGARSTVREFLPSDLTGEPSKPLGLIPTEVIQV